MKACSIPPISISTSSFHRPFPRISLYRTSWFSNLIMMMFTMALCIAAIILADVPGILSKRQNLPLLILTFFEILGLCALFLGIFIFICLATQSDRLRLPSRWKQSFEKLDREKQLMSQRILWTTTMGALLMAWVGLVIPITLGILGVKFWA